MSFKTFVYGVFTLNHGSVHKRRLIKSHDCEANQPQSNGWNFLTRYKITDFIRDTTAFDGHFFEHAFAPTERRPNHTLTQSVALGWVLLGFQPVNHAINIHVVQHREVVNFLIKLGNAMTKASDILLSLHHNYTSSPYTPLKSTYTVAFFIRTLMFIAYLTRFHWFHLSYQQLLSQ